MLLIDVICSLVLVVMYNAVIHNRDLLNLYYNEIYYLQQIKFNIEKMQLHRLHKCFMILQIINSQFSNLQVVKYLLFHIYSNCTNTTEILLELLILFDLNLSIIVAVEALTWITISVECHSIFLFYSKQFTRTRRQNTN